ncbi:hypothetical protein SISNIDRAFT_447498, partial [Sistotremastrum niveocremeum HHB9708]
TRRTPLFGRVKEGEWIYFGDYEFVASEPVSLQEWRDSPMEDRLNLFGGLYLSEFDLILFLTTRLDSTRRRQS